MNTSNRSRIAFTLLAGVLIAGAARADTLTVDEFPVVSGADDYDTEPTIGEDSGSRLVVFSRQTSGHLGDIWFQRVASDGQPMGPQFRVSNDPLGAETHDVLNDVSGDYIVYTAMEGSVGHVHLFNTQTLITSDPFPGVTTVKDEEALTKVLAKVLTKVPDE